MVVCAGGLLDGPALAEVRRLFNEGRFVPGRSTAGWAAAEVKDNLQMPADDAAHAQITALVMPALAGSDVVSTAALPRTVSPLLISKSEAGMGYGLHVDNALMGSPPLRTDISFTLFVSDEADYEGGELLINDWQGDQAVKLSAGSLALYPSTSLHEVTPVKSGVRQVVVGWMQSYVRDARIREMLFDLHRARLEIHAAMGRGAAFHAVTRAHSNLLRMFAEA